MVSIRALVEYLSHNYEYSNGELLRRFDYKQWKKGRAVGTIGKRGYKTLFILGRRYGLHQLIFVYHHGYLPRLIDHEDTDELNNRIENLRDLDKIGNALNISGPHVDNQSGFLGVTKRESGRFTARFRNKGLGTFDTPEEAHEAYLDFRRNEGVAYREAV